jgi:predicted transcriptional regulator
MSMPRALLLGDLERVVMDHLWSTGSLDVKSCHQVIGRRRRITLNTVQSTMERLHRKGLLRREKVSHAYVYAPSLTREAYGARLAHEVVSSVMGADAQASVLAAFVDLAERAGEEGLARMEALIAARRAEQRRPR